MGNRANRDILFGFLFGFLLIGGISVVPQLLFISDGLDFAAVAACLAVSVGVGIVGATLAAVFHVIGAVTTTPKRSDDGHPLDPDQGQIWRDPRADNPGRQKLNSPRMKAELIRRIANQRPTESDDRPSE